MTISFLRGGEGRVVPLHDRPLALLVRVAQEHAQEPDRWESDQRLLGVREKAVVAAVADDSGWENHRLVTEALRERVLAACEPAIVPAAEDATLGI